MEHKCIHRYVVRAKRGTVQSARDNKSGTSAPKSAGAQIRRYNEAQLEKEIQELLLKWAPVIETCGLIFHRTSVNNRRFLFLSKTAAKAGKEGESVGRPTQARVTPGWRRCACVAHLNFFFFLSSFFLFFYSSLAFGPTFAWQCSQRTAGYCRSQSPVNPFCNSTAHAARTHAYLCQAGDA